MTDSTHGNHTHGGHAHGGHAHDSHAHGGHAHEDPSFDKGYWEEHWTTGDSARRSPGDAAPNPYLVREISDRAPGTALDAGCGTGTEAIWLAERGWQVTGVDISSAALATAAERASQASVSEFVSWVEADLTTWQPDGPFDLVATHYAHATMPQLAFYERIAEWVAPGGTLLIVGHLPDPEGVPETDATPTDATVTAKDILAVLSPVAWHVDLVEENVRQIDRADGSALELHDVIVRATRIG